MYARRMAKIELLFEYCESRRCLRVRRENVCESIEQELSRFGKQGIRVQLLAHSGSSSSYLLQRWSTTWNTYIDVEDAADLEDKDRVTVVQMSSVRSPKVYINVIYKYIYKCHYWQSNPSGAWRQQTYIYRTYDLKDGVWSAWGAICVKIYSQGHLKISGGH